MSRTHLLNILAFLILTLALLHLSAIISSLYWRLWWFDMPVHFLGGSFITLSIVWFLSLSGYVPKRAAQAFPVTFAAVIIATIIIGIGWEVFERMLEHSWSVEGYWIDTIVDLVMDTAGGIVAYLLYFKSSRI